ncbi:hypothetical protein H0R92_05895 [Treponema sp. OMZ 840]|uniref:hypothetical protein n=1 Tax=Treponema sp. OMZ 840 TaxID=244313 RepID=UPI003D8E46C8
MIFYTDKKGRGIWTINPVFRMSMICIFVLTGAAAYIFPRTGEGSALPAAVVMQTVCVFLPLIGSVYRDCLIVEVQTKTLTYKTGFAFFVKKRMLSFEEIAAVCLVSVMQGKKSIETQCILRLKNGGPPLDIEHVKKNGRNALMSKAEKTAALIGCPVEHIGI